MPLPYRAQLDRMLAYANAEGDEATIAWVRASLRLTEAEASGDAAEADKLRRALSDMHAREHAADEHARSLCVEGTANRWPLNNGARDAK